MVQCNPGLAMQIQGWMEPEELLWLAAQATTCKNICEIGSWMGRSTRALADNCPGTVTAVDTWEGTPSEGQDQAVTSDPTKLFQTFCQNLAGLPKGRLRVHRDNSLAAAKYFSEQNELFDMIFIDASHDYESVKADIKAWVPLVRPGGVLCGHDYMYKWPEVVQAVNEAIPYHIMVAPTIWAVQVGHNTEGKNERKATEETRTAL